MFKKKKYDVLNENEYVGSIDVGTMLTIATIILAVVMAAIALGFAVTAYIDSRPPAPEAYNIYWVGNSHSSGGEMRYRLDIRSEIGNNIHIALPNSAFLNERFNDRWVSSDGYSRTELVAHECGLKYLNGWSIRNVRGSGFLYDYSISGASSIGNIRLSGVNTTVVGREKFSAFESVRSFLDAMGTNDCRSSDVVWFSANYNDIVFIAATVAGLPTNLPPGTTIPQIIGNATANHIELLGMLHDRGCKRVVVELWETINDINSPFWLNADQGFPGAVTGIQLALNGMIASIKGAINAKLATDWIDMDLYFDNISKHQLELLNNLNKYGINPALNTTIVSELEAIGRLRRNLYHWDDAHLSQLSNQHIAKFQCGILKKPFLDAEIGGL
jgi:hypothetical protein